MALGTAQAKPDYGDEAAARSAVMAALGHVEESPVEDEAGGDTDATETAADDVEDSDESADTTEESAEEGTESGDEEPVAAKATEEDSPFTAEDKAAIKADPTLARMAKGLLKSYTQKMQELGETAKFQKMIQGDPKTVLQRIAEANGLKVNFDDGRPAAPVTPAAEVTNSVQAVIDAQRAEWLPILGEGATNAMVAGMQKIAEAVAGSKVEPIVKGQTLREQEAAQAKVQEEFSRFEKEHPDWKSHEATMLALVPKINPALSTYEKTTLLYELATKDKQIVKAKTDAEVKHAAKVKKSVEDAEPAPRTRVPGGKVKSAPASYKTDQDAVRAALAEMGYTE